MSSIFQFMGGARATKSIVNGFSSNGWTPVAVSVSGGRTLLSGALTAATLKTLLSVSGAGEASSLALTCLDNSNRTLRLRVLVDGVTAFDSTSANVSASGLGCVIGFGVGGSGVIFNGSPIRFLTSLEVQVASSLTETDKLQLVYQLSGV